MIYLCTCCDRPLTPNRSYLSYSDRITRVTYEADGTAVDVFACPSCRRGRIETPDYQTRRLATLRDAIAEESLTTVAA